MSLSRTPPPRSVISSLPTLVIALTARERDLFLGSLASVPVIRHVHLIEAGDADLSPDRWEDFLRSQRPDILLTGWNSPPLPARWLDASDCSLRYVCHVTGSVSKVIPRSFLAAGGLVSNWGNFAGQFAAEHAMLLGLAALRNLNSWREFIAQPVDHREPEQLATRSLFGRRVGLHGFGSIARALVTLLRPFGVSLAAFSAGVPESELRDEGVEPCASLEKLFQRSEILFECEALTAATRGSVSASVLAALPDGAVFVNVGRGQVVDEAALEREAASGRLRVAVDVTRERMSDATPLFKIPAAVLSPHIAGPSHDQYRRCGELALQNIERYLRGEPPIARVTLEIYDRST